MPMGYSTDFLGRIDINPALNDEEQDYLRAFRLSRRYDRRDGPYAVPGNPYLDDREESDLEAYNGSRRGSQNCGASGRCAGTAVAWPGTGARSSTSR